MVGGADRVPASASLERCWEETVEVYVVPGATAEVEARYLTVHK
jgi:hypothetical protein